MLALFAAPGRAASLVTPEGRQAPLWSETQLGQESARIALYRNGDISAWYLRLAGREQPHAHREQELLVHVLEGRGAIHFGERVVPIGPGDVVLIPRGEEHWAESTGDSALVVFAAFTPAE
ncbi:cupin domain-containing protein [Parahaliea mediterranea]|uniref:Cupin domain-containing protein n=1 Tax=Parahaliea mediterranea TaxID=651086 RepID=A0A939IKC7_9GAMM|nr:cupin domain-containing protein [Parahaliea mediterranea]MBN7798614.1 cupin domain-containing protein [Parahaliea mediterranea]